MIGAAVGAVRVAAEAGSRGRQQPYRLQQRQQQYNSQQYFSHHHRHYHQTQYYLPWHQQQYQPQQHQHMREAARNCFLWRWDIGLKRDGLFPTSNRKTISLLSEETIDELRPTAGESDADNGQPTSGFQGRRRRLGEGHDVVRHATTAVRGESHSEGGEKYSVIGFSSRILLDEAGVITTVVDEGWLAGHVTGAMRLGREDVVK